MALAQLISGEVHAGSDGLLMFLGPPNTVIQWVLTAGEGTITPFREFTDARGYAHARYSPGLYVGPVQIRVDYGV